MFNSDESFSSSVLQALEDDIEVAERDGKEPLICRFLREEKEEDAGLLIRKDILEILHAENEGELAFAQEAMLLDMLDVVKGMQEKPECADQDRLLALLGSPKDASLEDALRNAPDVLQQKTAESKEEKKEQKKEQEKRRYILSEVGKLFIVLYDPNSDDPYIKLMAAEMDYEMNKETEEGLLETAKQIYKKSYQVDNENTRQILTGRMEPKNSFVLKKTVKDLAAAILKKKAKDDLYNYKTRSHNRCLDLVNSYCRYSGIVTEQRIEGDASGQLDINSDEFKQNAKNIYEYLINISKINNSDTAENICLPLFLDDKTGAGIFIIGKNHLPETAYTIRGPLGDKLREKSCNFCYMAVNTLWTKRDAQEQDVLMEYNATKSATKDLDILIQFDTAACESIEDAVMRYNKEREGAYEAYGALHGLLPQNIKDERLWPYFDKGL